MMVSVKRRTNIKTNKNNNMVHFPFKIIQASDFICYKALCQN